MPLKKLMTKWRNNPYVSAHLYRIPMPVKEMIQYKNGDCYPVCPRCGVSMEREYVHFCDRCGQRLAWNDFEYARVVCYSQNEKDGGDIREDYLEQEESLRL